MKTLLIAVLLVLGTNTYAEDNYTSTIRYADQFYCSFDYEGTRTKKDKKYKMTKFSELEEINVTYKVTNNGKTVAGAHVFKYTGLSEDNSLMYKTGNGATFEIKKLKKKPNTNATLYEIHAFNKSHTYKMYGACIPIIKDND